MVCRSNANLRWFCCFLILISSFALFAGTDQTPPAKLNLKFAVNLDPKSMLPTQLTGHATYQFPNKQSRLCFYLPFNDPDYGLNRRSVHHLELVSRKFSRVNYKNGSTEISATSAHQKIRQIYPYLIEISLEQPDHTVSLAFDSQTPRLHNADPHDQVYDGFYPQPLEACPEESLHSSYYMSLPSLDITAEVSYPKDWLIALPGEIKPSTIENQTNIKLQAKEFIFALLKDFKKITFDASNITVEFFFRSEKFAELVDTFKYAMESHIRFFGPFPFPRVVVIETSELQKPGMPGLITLNKPNQPIFSALQTKWLNWGHWNLVTLLANQWFGGSISVKSLDDLWLTRGMADMAALEALRQNTNRYNLFNIYEIGYTMVSFNYLQIQDLTAAMLLQYAPFSILTTPGFKSFDPYHLQHPLLFVRHAIALRQLKSIAGDNAFYRFIRNFTQAKKFKSITPKDFHDYVFQVPNIFSEQKQKLIASVLTQWWTTHSWPDFSLEDLEYEQTANGKWLCKVKVKQNSAISLPIEVIVKDVNNKGYLTEAQRTQYPDLLVANIVTDAKPKNAVVDPNHNVFDSDRFNNSSKFPTLSFFPGGAKTLTDDGYTIVWAPYPFRHPGQSLSLGLQAALFRYIHGGIFLRVETELADGDTGFMLKNRYTFPTHAVGGEIFIQQNIYGHRTTEFNIGRDQLLEVGPKIGLSLKARHKQVVGQKTSRHQTLAIGTSLSPRGRPQDWGYQIIGEYERAPEALSHDFSYERQKISAEANYYFAGYFDLNLRSFYGTLNSQGSPPESAFFDPEDLSEARIRFDVSKRKRVENIASLNTDILFPLLLPLPGETMILSRQVKWRLFYDYGQALKEDIEYRAGGGGFLMPLGGELSGAGSLALTQLSFLVVLYSKVEGEISHKPRILFDLTGEL